MKFFSFTIYLLEYNDVDINNFKHQTFQNYEEANKACAAAFSDINSTFSCRSVLTINNLIPKRMHLWILHRRVLKNYMKIQREQ
jgi:hypothetical protein